MPSDCFPKDLSCEAVFIIGWAGPMCHWLGQQFARAGAEYWETNGHWMGSIESKLHRQVACCRAEQWMLHVHPMQNNSQQWCPGPWCSVMVILYHNQTGQKNWCSDLGSKTSRWIISNFEDLSFFIFWVNHFMVTGRLLSTHFFRAKIMDDASASTMKELNVISLQQ